MTIVLRGLIRIASPTIRSLSSKAVGSQQQYWKDRVHLAGAYRIIDRLGLNEGICNHLTLMSRMPGAKPEGTSVMLVIPYGQLWSEVRASTLLAIDENDKVVDGEGDVDITALTIHREVHKLRSDAAAVFHTHMPYTTALAVSKDPKVVACHQNSSRFVKDMAYDYGFGGYADNDEEGKRIARQFEEKPFMIMQTHGSLITGPTTAHAFDRLYYLERVCMFQVLSASTGRPLTEMSDEVLERTRKSIWDFETVSVEPHFDARLRLLQKTDPDFAT